MGYIFQEAGTSQPFKIECTDRREQETGASQPFIIECTDRRERHFQENRSSRPAIFIAQTDSYSNDGKSDHLNSMYLGCADTRILGFHENSTSLLSCTGSQSAQIAVFQDFDVKHTYPTILTLLRNHLILEMLFNTRNKCNLSRSFLLFIYSK